MSSSLSRRRMLQLTGTTAFAAAALAITGCAKEEDEAPVNTDITLKVYDPTGSVEVSQTFSPRLDGIDGKTIAFLCNDMWQQDRTFAAIKEQLETRYTGVKVITQDNFPGTTQDLTKDKNGIAEMMKELGVDAAIVGNAG